MATTVTITAVGVQSDGTAINLSAGSSGYCTLNGGLNMTATTSTDALTGVNVWALTPNSSDIMPSSATPTSPFSNQFATNALQNCRSATLYFGTTGTTESPVSIDLYVNQTAGATLAFESFPVTAIDSYTFTQSSAKLTITRGPGATGLAWVSLAFTANIVFAVTTVASIADPSFGMQAIAVSTTSTPPAACFGEGTLVLCEDGQRRDIAHMRGGTARVMAFAPDAINGPPVPIQVDIYRHTSATQQHRVYEAAPGVWVTKDHAVHMQGRPRPESARAPDVALVHDKFEGCSWIAGDLPGCQGLHTMNGVYHLVPTDTTFLNHAVVVGTDDTCAAELYRSPVDVLVTMCGFVKHE